MPIVFVFYSVYAENCFTSEVETGRIKACVIAWKECGKVMQNKCLQASILITSMHDFSFLLISVSV